MTRRHRWQNLAPALVREGIRAVITDSAEPELLIYDYLDSWGDEWGVSATDVVAALDGIGQVPSLTVRLNSPGGDYFEGVAIYNALVSHPAKVTVQVDGLAASAASVVAMAADRVVMGMGAQLMVHEARVGVLGATADELRATALMVDQTNDDIAGFYAARAGGDPAAWREAVRAETWYTAQQAVAAGLADEVATPPTRQAPPVTEPAPAAAVTPLPAPRAEACCGGACCTNTDPAPGQAEDPADPATTAEATPETALPTASVDLSELLRSAIREGVTT